MFPRTDGSKTTHRYQFNQLKPCGVRGLDNKGEMLINQGYQIFEA